MRSPQPSEEIDPLGESTGFQNVEWRLNRIGWVVMTLIVLAGLLGLLGDGPLSQAQVTSSDGRLDLTYDRIVRNQGISELVARLPQANDEPTRLRISQDFLVTNQLVAITPQPTASFARGGGMIFEFAPPEPRKHGSAAHGPGPLKVRMDLRPTGGPGTRHATITTDNSSVHIGQFAYP